MISKLSLSLLLVFSSAPLLAKDPEPAKLVTDAIPVIQAAAKAANKGLIEIKEIMALEKTLTSEKDKTFLKSISNRPFLPKGFKAVPFLDQLIVLNKQKQVVASAQILGLKPLRIKTMSGRVYEIDPKNRMGSFQTADVGGPSFFEKILGTILPEARAQQNSDDEIEKRVLFLTSLYMSSGPWRNQKLAWPTKQWGWQGTDDDQARVEFLENSIQKALAEFDFESTVLCSGSQSGLVVKKGEYSARLSSSPTNLLLYCSKTSLAFEGFKPGEMHSILNSTATDINNLCVGSDFDERRSLLASRIKSTFFDLLKKEEPSLFKIFTKYPNIAELTCGALELNNNTPLALSDIKKIKTTWEGVCQSSPEAKELKELKSTGKESRPFAERLYQHRQGLSLISQALDRCCGDNNCRLQATGKNLNLELAKPPQDSEGTK